MRELVFLMGQYEARLPCDRRYARNHMWCLHLEGDRYRFGFSAYAVRLMRDVYFLDWQIAPGTTLRVSQPIGHIETSKATSDLFAPADGTLIAFNTLLLQDPSWINVEPYERGWLFDMACAAAPGMPAEDYVAFLAPAWEKAQKLLKRQMNLRDPGGSVSGGPA